MMGTIGEMMCPLYGGVLKGLLKHTKVRMLQGQILRWHYGRKMDTYNDLVSSDPLRFFIHL